MHYRKLERFKMIALATNREKYEAKILLLSEAINEISWWVDNIIESNAPILRDYPSSTLDPKNMNQRSKPIGWKERQFFFKTICQIQAPASIAKKS